MRIFTVDSFTNKAFKGNPAAVCVLDKPLTEATYIDIAQEMNLSETAFVYLEAGNYQLKWFTPLKEVDLCGHATLAAAKILFEKYAVKQDVIEFFTKSGILTVRKSDDGKLEMNFPKGALTSLKGNDEILEVFLNEKPIAISVDKDWCLVELSDEASIINLKPKINLLLDHERKLFIITAKSSNSKHDFISRFFAPAMGIDEDPVTGSAHCYLANYWSGKLSKNTLIGYQASKRGGVVACEILNNDRVLLRGDCVIMAELFVERDWSK